MSLSITVDRSVDFEDVFNFLEQIESLQSVRNHVVCIDDGDLGDNTLVHISLTVPGTYDEFPEIVRELAIRNGICPDKVVVTVRPDPDGWE